MHQHLYLVKRPLGRFPSPHPRHSQGDHQSWATMGLPGIKSLTAVYLDHQLKTLARPPSLSLNHHTRFTRQRKALRTSVLVPLCQDQLIPCGLAHRSLVLFCHRCRCLNQILVS